MINKINEASNYIFTKESQYIIGFIRILLILYNSLRLLNIKKSEKYIINNDFVDFDKNILM
jgi:hypothetical protein